MPAKSTGDEKSKQESENEQKDIEAHLASIEELSTIDERIHSDHIGEYKSELVKIVFDQSACAWPTLLTVLEEGPHKTLTYVMQHEGYFAIPSATGDLVDNHDIVQFSVRSLEGVDDPNGDYDRWEHSVRLAHEAKSSDYELRPQEVMQRDYARVVRAQASALRSLTADVEQLKQQLEFRMAAMQVATEVTRENMDDKSDEVANIASAFERTERAASALEEHSSRHLLDITKKLEVKPRNHAQNLKTLKTWKHSFPFVNTCPLFPPTLPPILPPMLPPFLPPILPPPSPAHSSRPFFPPILPAHSSRPFITRHSSSRFDE